MSISIRSSTYGSYSNEKWKSATDLKIQYSSTTVLYKSLLEEENGKFGGDVTAELPALANNEFLLVFFG